MRLKLQMLLAGAVTLAIPFAGWHSIRQLDEALEDTRRREQTLRVANASAALAQNTALQALLQTRKRSPQPNDIYASKAKFPIFLDGYADDWRELNVTQFRFTPTDDAAQEDSSMLSVRASVREHNLYLFIRIADDDVVFHRPPRQVVEYAEGERPDPFAQLSNGDALELLVQRPSGNATHGLFRAVAPGPLMARVASATDRRRLGQSLGSWRGHWTTDNDGLRLEVVMPRPPDGASFGLAYVDVATRGDPKPSWVGNLSPVLMAERHSSDRQSNTDPRLTIASLSADVQLKPWVSAGTRLRVFDAHGLLLADVNQLYANDADNIAFDLAKSSFWDALVFRFVSAMLRDRDDADTDTP